MAHGASELHGVGVGRGVAVGRVLSMPEPLSEPVEGTHNGDAAAEKAAVAAAVVTAAAELQARADRADGAGKEVIEAAIQMAQDPMLADDVNARIDSGITGERAVFEGFRSFQEQLTALGGYMAERAADLGDVSQRIIAALRGVPVPGVPESETPFILLARDLAPADTALLDLNKVLGLVTRDGGPTSHTAILARAKAIPAIVGVGADAAIADGTRVILDAASGIVTVDPDDAQVADAEKRIAERAAQAAAPITDGALADGTKIPLLANLGSPADAAKAVELGAEGVGLFRTEFLFLDSATAPSVADQQKQYSELLSHFAGKKVVVRALDAGADKPLAFLNDAHEENPALGLRGLRALRDKQQILTDQLQALKNAQDETAASGHPADLWVMAPMVADAGETQFFVEFGKQLGLKTVGVMAEVPSLALVADQVLKIADFVSIGTNDLTQYTLAAERGNGAVAAVSDALDPGVLQLIDQVCRACAGRVDVAVCGEAASDELAIPVLVGLGARELSVSPHAVPRVKASIRELDLGRCQDVAQVALTLASGDDVRKLVLAMSSEGTD